MASTKIVFVLPFNFRVVIIAVVSPLESVRVQTLQHHTAHGFYIVYCSILLYAITTKWWR